VQAVVVMEDLIVVSCELERDGGISKLNAIQLQAGISGSGRFGGGPGHGGKSIIEGIMVVDVDGKDGCCWGWTCAMRGTMVIWHEGRLDNETCQRALELIDGRNGW